MKEDAKKKEKVETPVKTVPKVQPKIFVPRKSLPAGSLRPLLANLKVDTESPIEKLMAQSPTKLKGSLI